ncbi:class I SAM-dependent methyltransferase [Candidatus Dependentiae bacterium]|nr:class I SAM-dependent methyltransferase [Candidatus Dependentiae bacterium]
MNNEFIKLIIKKVKSRLSEIKFFIFRIAYKKKILKKIKNIDRIFTHLTSEEKYILYELALKKNGVFVEIGSFLGASSLCIARALKEKNKNEILYCVDTWENDAMNLDKNDTFDEFLNNTFDYKNYIIPIRGFSYNTANEFSCKIDFIFFDGDHSYAGIKKDWDLWSSKLSEKAIVVFHDWGWAEGVKKVISEDAVKKVEYKGSLPNLWWGIKN